METDTEVTPSTRGVESLSDTESVAKEILSACRAQRNFVFYGELGSGKTTMIKFMCKALGVEDETASPSFAIIHQYKMKRGSVYHFDFFRLRNEAEAMDLGLDEYFSSGNYCFIECPEKILPLIPDDAVKIHIKMISETQREISFHSN